MPATPIIQKTGATSGPSVAGQGSNDLVAGERVDLADLEPANVGSAYLWEFEDTPVGTSPTMNDHTTATPHFFVDVDDYLSGSYRVKCNVDGVEFSTEVFAKPLPNTGARIPSFQEQEEFDEAGNPVGWHEAQTVFQRIVDDLLGSAKTSVTERQAAMAVPTGNSIKEIELGGVLYPGSALAISGKLEDPVTAGTVEVRLKVNGAIKLTAVLSTGAATFAADIDAAGVHPILNGDLLTVEVETIGYGNAGSAPSGLAITAAFSNSLSNAPLEVVDASHLTKGVSKLSVAPAVATNPIAVGTNDDRVPSQTENDAMAGTSGVPSDSNRYVTNSDPRNSDSRAPLGHTLAGAAHASDTLANLNSKISDATLIDTADSRLSDARTPTSHAIAGTEHSSSTLAQLNAKVSDATLDDAGDTRTPSAHGLGGAEHSTATLAQLNAKVSDATLIDTGDSRLSDARTPTSHAASHQNGGADEVGTQTPADGAIPKAGPGSSSLAAGWIPDGGDGTAIHDNVSGEINALSAKGGGPVGADVLLIEDSAGSFAKAKTAISDLPVNSHGIAGTEHSADTLANLSSKVSDATLAGTDVTQAFTKQQYPTPLALTDAAAVAITPSDRNAFTLLATAGVGNSPRELSNPGGTVSAGMSWTLAFTNDTGARDLTFAANYSWGDEVPPTFTTQAAGEITLLTFFALSSTKIVVTALTGH